MSSSLADVNATKASAATTTSEMTPEELRRQKQEWLALKMKAYFFRFLFLFHAVTQQYVTQYYLLDFAFQNCSSLTRTLLRLWAWHLCLVGTVNWLCLMYYRDEYDPARHRPSTPAPDLKSLQPQKAPAAVGARSDSNLTNSNDDDSRGDAGSARADGDSARAVNNGGVTEDSGSSTTATTTTPTRSQGTPLQWSYCERCQMATPPRTRHCKKCKLCVVRRDHHCDLVGYCVGHSNQRFFVVLASYGMAVAYIGAYMTLTYLYHHHPEGTSLWDYFLPITFFQGLLGDVSALQVLLTYHAYMLVIFCPLTLVYFLSEMSVILQGKTMREVMKRMKHVQVSSSVADRLQVAFGDHWWLNFVFPTVFFLPHAHNGMDFTGVVVTDPPAETAQRSDDKKQD